MNITELRYLVAIKKWGSVSAAAKQLYAAQPNVSKALKKLEEEYGDQIYIGKVNVAYEQELVEEYKVMSAPTLIFLKDGEQIEKLTGAKKAADLEEIIDKNL